MQRRILYAILAGYLILAGVYSIKSPLFEVSDELWHYPMVKYLADNGMRLPPQDPANIGPWRQEGSQPPLYYMLGAALTAAIDTADMDQVRRQNPHADIGVIRPDGNVNMMVHRADLEAFPWNGTALAVHLLRFFSIALGLGTVLVAFQLGRELFPERPEIALGAAALTAFLPMFLFISGSVNNDNLSNLLGNLLTLLIVRLLKATERPTLRTYIIVGTVAGAGLLAKLNLGFLIPFVALAFLILSIRLRDWRPLVYGGALSGGLTIVIAGWWYWRNWRLYDDPTGLNRFLDIVGRRALEANPAQLWNERNSFLQAYWGFFGGVNVPLPNGVYTTFNTVGGLALLSAVAFAIYTIARKQWQRERWLSASITIIWPIVTFLSFLRWTTITPASQGRLIFGALASIALWMAVGLVWWLPRRWNTLPLLGAGGFFAVVAALAPFTVIGPAYRQPDAIADAEALALFEAAEGGAIALLGSEVSAENAHPQSYVEFAVEWQAAEALGRDWSMFVHLATPDGVIVGQRDVYPGGGTLATSEIPEGFAWNNPLAVWVPEAAFTPMTLDINVGWYHLPTGERLVLEDGAESVTVGQIDLLPGASELGVPNPLDINFDNRIELVGYDLSELSPAAGDEIELSLYWRGKQALARDYIVFVHILDPQTNTIYAASDAQPAQWSAPTTTWQPGTVVEDVHTLTVNPDAPPGIYELEIGLYSQEAGGSFPRLRVIADDGGQANNFALLSRVRIAPGEGES